MLRWPAQDEARAALLRRSVPRLLLVQEGVQPPSDGGCLEDWTRLPANAEDIRVRLRTLARRGREHSAVPDLDEFGQLSHRGRRAAVTDRRADHPPADRGLRFAGRRRGARVTRLAAGRTEQERAARASLAGAPPHRAARSRDPFAPQRRPSDSRGQRLLNARQSMSRRSRASSAQATSSSNDIAAPVRRVLVETVAERLPDRAGIALSAFGRRDASGGGGSARRRGRRRRPPPLLRTRR